MTITINKNSSATVLTINNFTNLTITGDTPVDRIGNIAGTESDADLLKFDGATMDVSFQYIIMDEASTVVSGTGSPVTTAIGQVAYLYSTLMSTGTSSFTDTYTLTLTFNGGSTFSRTGILSKIVTQMSSDQPLTFVCNMTFSVGTTL